MISGYHRSRRVLWDTFQRGNVDCYEIDYSVVPFTMRKKKLRVIKKNRQKSRRIFTELSLLFWEQEFVCIPWRLIFEEPACKRELSGNYICCTELTYIIHLEGFSLRSVSYSAIYYACSNFILFHTIAVETSIHVNSEYLYA